MPEPVRGYGYAYIPEVEVKELTDEQIDAIAYTIFARYYYGSNSNVNWKDPQNAHRKPLNDMVRKVVESIKFNKFKVVKELNDGNSKRK